MIFEELKALVLLNRFGRGVNREVRGMIYQGISPSEVLEKIEAGEFPGKSEKLASLRGQFDPAREIERCETLGIRLVDFFHQEYPPRLKQIADPPLVLYVRGSFLETDGAAVAVVGSRHPSLYGREQAFFFAHQLAQAGLTVVSGLARGIDQAAHEGAIRVPHGRTFGVLGCGMDIIYPPENKLLFSRVQNQGCLVSEYALGMPPLAENFPCRNRIISGLSLGVFVVEAHQKSGSLITAREALDQGRDVFALPGPVNQLTSAGTHQLLKDGAFLAVTPSDIIEVLAPQIREFTGLSSDVKSAAPELLREDILEPGGVSVEEGELVEVLNKKGAMAFDELVFKTRFPAARLSLVLTGLEIQNKVKKDYRGRFQLC